MLIIVTWVAKEIKTLRLEELAMNRQSAMKRSWIERTLQKPFDPCKKKRVKFYRVCGLNKRNLSIHTHTGFGIVMKKI